MNLVLVSNYLNAHMKPLCEAFARNPAVEKFTFVATEPFGEERKKMGFADVQEGVAYVFKAYGKEVAKNEALRMVEAADVAIIAHAPDDYVHMRMKENKLTFLCSERFYKLGLWRRFVPSSYIKKKKRFLQYRDKRLYYLTIGAYTPYDLNLVGFPLEKCFQWAYFPKTALFTAEEVKKKNNDKIVKLFWAGRLVSRKHPEVAIKTAQRLKKEGIKFELNIAGDGALLPKIRRLIETNALEDTVHLLGNCTPKKVQQYMQESDIYLFTSDYWEGWGAVLSEAMAAGCVPIASAAAGASHILIQSGENGFLYNRFTEIENYIVKLYFDKTLQQHMAIHAWETINKQWSAATAAKKFVETVEEIQRGTMPCMEEGPMKNPELRKARNHFGTGF